MPEPSASNGRVTIAELGKDVKYMRDSLDELKTALLKHCDLDTKREERVTVVEKDVLRLQERMSTLSRWTVGLGIFSPTLAGFLAWVASQFGLGK